MAMCFKCGASGSSHRRTVQTGYSNSIYSGKSTASRRTTYHHVRTLCESCAYDHDQGKAIGFVLLQLIIMGGILYYLFQ